MPDFSTGWDDSQGTTLINGVPCAETHDGYEEGVSGRQPYSNKTVFCDWNKRFVVANYALGLSTITGGTGGIVTFAPPLQHVDIPSLYVGGIKIIGVGRPLSSGGSMIFPCAKITFAYQSFPWSSQAFDDSGFNQQFDPGTPLLYATQDIDHASESIEYPGTALCYDATPAGAFTAGVSLNHSLSIPVSHAIMRITFHKMPALPVATLQYNFKVNDSTFLGCAKGTCQFLGSQTHREFFTAGEPTQTVTNTYRYRPAADWNMFPNPNVAFNREWIFVRKTAPGNPFIYPYANLENTFPNPGYVY